MDHFRRSWRLTGAAAVLLLVAAGILIAVAQSGTLSEDDREALLNAASGRVGPLTTAAITITTVGNTTAMAVLAIVVGGFLWWRGRRRPEAVYAVGAMATASLLFTVIKRLLDRPRPPAQLQVIRETNESLPSGHATMSAAVIGSLVILAWPHLAALGRTVWTLAAVVWVGAVGTTRIYLGVHWLSDVLAGWALGLGWTTLCAAVLFRWRARTLEGAQA